MAEYYYYVPIGSIVFFICLCVYCCQRASRNRSIQRQQQGQVVVIPVNPNQQAGVWHTAGGQAGQTPYYAGPGNPPDGFAKMPENTQYERSPTGYTGPYNANSEQASTQQAYGYSDPQHGYGYSNPELPPYPAISSPNPDNPTAAPSGESREWDRPPPYNMAVNLDATK